MNKREMKKLLIKVVKGYLLQKELIEILQNKIKELDKNEMVKET